MRILTGFLFILLFSDSRAAKVDTVSIYSTAMHKSYKCVVVIPNSNANEKFPVVYLLHGYSGSYDNWIKKVPEIAHYADEYHMMIVCPEGEYGSWYYDSPIDSSMKFETYVAKEVPAFIDAHYNTIRDRSKRAIAGLSMGGHGGLFLAFRHSDFFGACGSMSGVLVIEDHKWGYDLIKRLGDTVVNAHYYHELSAFTEVEHYPVNRDSLAIIIDCGVDDGFIAMNRKVHEKMLRLKIPHDYIERPGGHSWQYWANAVEYQLIFFRNFFDGR